MALSEARRKANEKYIAKAYGSVAIRWPREFCDLVRAEAEASGETLAGYVRKAIEQRINAEGVHKDA